MPVCNAPRSMLGRASSSAICTSIIACYASRARRTADSQPVASSRGCPAALETRHDDPTSMAFAAPRDVPYCATAAWLQKETCPLPCHSNVEGVEAGRALRIHAGETYQTKEKAS